MLVEREVQFPTTTDENIKYGKELSEDKVSIHGEKYTDIPQWIGQQYPSIKELTVCSCEIPYDWSMVLAFFSHCVGQLIISRSLPSW
jgi:hypothetical protein